MRTLKTKRKQREMEIQDQTGNDIKVEVVTQCWSLNPGDHIAVQGERSGFKFFHHHGIFIGFREGVIHSVGKISCGGKEIDENQLQKNDIFEFSGQTKPIKRVIYGINECLPPMEVVERANSLLDGRMSWDNFNLITNNCEHFATYCKTGEAKSKQTEKIEELLNSVKSTVKYYEHKSSSYCSSCC